MALTRKQLIQERSQECHEARYEDITAVADQAAIKAGQQLVDQIRLEESILAYVLELVRATRSDSAISHGVSTRAADGLCGAVRALAALEGRDFAIPDDVKHLFTPAMRHRIVLSPTAEIEGRTPDEVLAQIVNQIEAPR